MTTDELDRVWQHTRSLHRERRSAWEHLLVLRRALPRSENLTADLLRHTLTPSRRSGAKRHRAW